MSVANFELSKDCLITRVSNSAAAGTSEVDSTILDMTNYDAVCFIALFNTVVDASVLTLTAKENTTSSTSGATAVTGGAAGPITASTNSNAVMMTDVIRPAKQFVYAALTRTAQNATLDGIIAIQYRVGKVPVT